MSESSKGPLVLHWPDGPAGARPVALSGEERVSEPFRFDVHLNVEPKDGETVNLSRLVDSECSVGLVLASGGVRWIHGLTTEVGAVAAGPGGITLHLVLEPPLALLRRRAAGRVFQDQTPGALVEAVCEPLGRKMEIHVHETGKPRSYRVQYDESDLNFLERILEDEGWIYSFDHKKGALRWHVREGRATGEHCPGPHEISPRAAVTTEDLDDVIRDASLAHRGLTGSVSLCVAGPDGSATSVKGGSGDGASTWVVPAWPVVGWDGQGTAPVQPEATSRTNALESSRVVLRVAGALRGLVPGGTVKVRDLPAALDADGTYFVWSTSITASEDGVDVVAELVPSGTLVAPGWRAARRRAVGPQLAVVAGDTSGAAVTDDLGRIQVRFPWDESGATSCWIPVVQGLAGQEWGTRFIPRVGQTVVVDFVDGDPEQPLVVGTVHHPGAKPGSYDAPERFGWRSEPGGPKNRSSEITIRDPEATEGDPEVLIRAQTDLCVDVDRDFEASILGTTTVQAGGEEPGVTLAMDTEGNVSTDVNGNVSTDVKGDSTHQIAGKLRTETKADATLKANGTLEINASEIVLNASKITLKGGELTLSGSKLDASTTGDVSVSATGNVSVQATQNLTNEATLSLTNKAGLSLTNEAGTTLSQKANIMIESEAEAGQKVDTSGMLVLGGSMIQLG